eukprot:TRINITY_DN35026_c0_g1_i3.p1 TRINITY_DN35026_c0_g1~~TRINITY_DN35026_c0_g1_i3.p1  ORF type:complete len:313 (+),score=36.57 TRINITY_DN35026_c0_g1_i3:158-1096(+)
MCIRDSPRIVRPDIPSQFFNEEEGDNKNIVSLSPNFKRKGSVESVSSVIVSPEIDGIQYNQADYLFPKHTLSNSKENSTNQMHEYKKGKQINNILSASLKRGRSSKQKETTKYFIDSKKNPGDMKNRRIDFILHDEQYRNQLKKQISVLLSPKLREAEKIALRDNIIFREATLKAKPKNSCSLPFSFLGLPSSLPRDSQGRRARIIRLPALNDPRNFPLHELIRKGSEAKAFGLSRIEEDLSKIIENATSHKSGNNFSLDIHSNPVEKADHTPINSDFQLPECKQFKLQITKEGLYSLKKKYKENQTLRDGS